MCGVPHVRTGLGGRGGVCSIRELEMMSFIEAQRRAETEQPE